MARKQQRILTSATETLAAIHKERIALQAKINEIRADFEALKQKHAELTDKKAVQQTRRKLRYPST